MLSLGTEDFLAFWMASNRVGLPSGSPPPVRAATSMFLISLANSLPRLASLAAFWCLVVAHLEWPLIVPPNPSRLVLPDPSAHCSRRPTPRPESDRGASTGDLTCRSRLRLRHQSEEQGMQPVVTTDLGVKRGG